MSKIPIPDLRFESSFRKSLNTEYSKAGINASTESVDRYTNAMVITKVIMRDLIFMPLIQGFIFSSLMILARPWLVKVARNGRQFGVAFFQSLGLRPKPLA
ncbi:unnamed protein product [Cyberlindnera jadinii]|uniref:Uncharacterized protein n=1 Tax=Cyberlindnera jadinii (strain ATCC 18201 / CBS 1600 / BCRC 20928 / JCM 3617 / NBRC 0987 / NRRL Y-1542) TaxID=983966 RepID=A0A0H5CL63_CYBJN|nr:hypothetical protein CYBJADRAFT_186591 [Cyberlindnera jadinii NRRL Y-1542]ODV71478.1 hypothetical protein CYBJADRAFT_186591 [Cyberlindnera jadinii NRRL Y-1542]CEP25204.1 unnamed protein product [Cyberlindnera jadinii]